MTNISNLKNQQFHAFLKKSINWLYLINNDFNKDCAMHKFLIDKFLSEHLLKDETDKEKKAEIFWK